MAGQWVVSGGGVIPTLVSGKHAAMLLCRRDGKVFHTSSKKSSLGPHPNDALFSYFSGRRAKQRFDYGFPYSGFGACQSKHLFLGQMDGKDTSNPEGALHRYAAAVSLGNVFNNGEPKAGAA